MHVHSLFEATGRAPSVEALFRVENRTHYFKQGLQDMRAGSPECAGIDQVSIDLENDLNLIAHAHAGNGGKPCALYISSSSDTSSQHCQRVVAAQTVFIERNALRSRTSRRKNSTEFILFSREQGAAFGDSRLNDWLKNRRASHVRLTRQSTQRTITAGIHVFAFSDEDYAATGALTSATHPSTPFAKSSRHSSSADPS